jgi:hypothetical protein
MYVCKCRMSAFTSLAEWQVAVYEAALRQLLWHLGLDVSDAATYQQYPFEVVDSLFTRYNEYLCSSEAHDAVSASLNRLTSCCIIACSQGSIIQHTGPASLPTCRWWAALSACQRNDSAPVRGRFTPDVHEHSRRAEPASSG